jgi:hypothetical protein
MMVTYSLITGFHLESQSILTGMARLDSEITTNKIIGHAVVMESNA